MTTECVTGVEVCPVPEKDIHGDTVKSESGPEFSWW